MTIEIINCEQGTAEWFAHRAGIPTASNFQAMMAGGAGLTRSKYMRVLAGEIITGECVEGYNNGHMNDGHQQEAAIRQHYAFEMDVEPVQVGFVKNGLAGYSPDSFIGNDGLLEVKRKIPDLLIECLQKDRFPPEHRWQCQGGLWVAEREWIDIAIGWLPEKRSSDPAKGLPVFIKRAYRDDAFILEIKTAVIKFRDELEELVNKIKNYAIAA